jgi:hypothetical protein
MAAFMDMVIAQQQALTKVVGRIREGTSNKGISGPTKPTGNDDKWKEWRKLLRSYFKLKGWLLTFDHPIGPGTPDNPTPSFDFDINTKMHSKLQHLCHGGPAATHVAKAAEFDGHGAGVHLRGRHGGFTKQKLKQYEKLLRDLRQANGYENSRTRGHV